MSFLNMDRDDIILVMAHAYDITNEKNLMPFYDVTDKPTMPQRQKSNPKPDISIQRTKSGSIQ